jgi:very-short-patch-repair endonuclease
MAAVLACGPNALLSDWSAAALWGIGIEKRWIDVSVRTCSDRGRGNAGVRVHRRAGLRAGDLAVRDGIPVTTPVQTLVDLAAVSRPAGIERMVNEADRLDLVDPEALRAALGDHRGQRGVGRLRAVLDRRTFRLTRSGLERRFLPLAEQAGLPVPLTRQWVNGFEVDFYWPELGLVVETDGLRYHRTPAEQARDRLRDQAHTAAGLTPLRFTHAQVTFEAPHVGGILASVARRLLQGS